MLLLVLATFSFLLLYLLMVLSILGKVVAIVAEGGARLVANFVLELAEMAKVAY